MHIHGLHLKGCALNDVESALFLSRIHKKRTDSLLDLNFREFVLICRLSKICLIDLQPFACIFTRLF